MYLLVPLHPKSRRKRRLTQSRLVSLAAALFISVCLHPFQVFFLRCCYASLHIGGARHYFALILCHATDDTVPQTRAICRLQDVSEIRLGGESDDALALGTDWMSPLPGVRLGGLRGAGAGAGAQEVDMDTVTQAGAMKTGLKISMAIRGSIPQMEIERGTKSAGVLQSTGAPHGG
jgi:hypothetical protein